MALNTRYEQNTEAVTGSLDGIHDDHSPMYEYMRL
jgi:hypothetical protein